MNYSPRSRPDMHKAREEISMALGSGLPQLKFSGVAQCAHLAGRDNKITFFYLHGIKWASNILNLPASDSQL